MKDKKMLKEEELEKVSGGSEAIDPFLPGTIDYAKETLIMENNKVLNEEELKKVNGGVDLLDLNKKDEEDAKKKKDNQNYKK